MYIYYNILYIAQFKSKYYVQRQKNILAVIISYYTIKYIINKSQFIYYIQHKFVACGLYLLFYILYFNTTMYYITNVI